MSASCSMPPESRRSLKNRNRGVALLSGAGELRQRDDGTAEFAGQVLEAPGNVAHLLRAVLARCTVGHLDELEIVDDEQVEPMLHLLPPRLAAEVADRRDPGRRRCRAGGS